MPVPSVTQTTHRAAPARRRSGTRPRRRRWRRSRRAAAARSGRPSASRSGSLRQARCGENSTVARSLAIHPAAPMPTATTSCRAASSFDHLGDHRLGLGDVVTRRRPALAVDQPGPSSSTTPAATLVPPMSTPMARLRSVSGRQPVVRDRCAARPRRGRFGAAGCAPDFVSRRRANARNAAARAVPASVIRSVTSGRSPRRMPVNWQIGHHWHSGCRRARPARAGTPARTQLLQPR